MSCPKVSCPKGLSADAKRDADGSDSSARGRSRRKCTSASCRRRDCRAGSLNQSCRSARLLWRVENRSAIRSVICDTSAGAVQMQNISTEDLRDLFKLREDTVSLRAPCCFLVGVC
eukprot:118626-Rhodomonas_salina.3